MKTKLVKSTLPMDSSYILDEMAPDTEGFLSALRRRDGDALLDVAQNAAHVARNAGAEFVMVELQPHPESYRLGALDMLSQLTATASVRHDGNSRFEAIRDNEGVAEFLVAVGRGDDASMPSPKVIGKLLVAGVVRKSGNPKSKYPVKLTSAGKETLEREHPGWYRFGLLESDDAPVRRAGGGSTMPSTAKQGPAL